MYAHQVIEDLKDNLSFFEKFKFFHRTLIPSAKDVIGAIRQAHKFHIGTSSGFDHLLQNGSRPFFDENGGVRLPYDVCWFDYDYDLFGKEREYSKNAQKVLDLNKIKEQQMISRKRGILALNTEEAIFAMFFNFLEREDSKFLPLEKSGWHPSLVSELILVDKTAEEHSDFNNIKEKINYIKNQDLKNINMIPLPNADPPAIQSADDILQHHIENGDELKALNAVLMFLNCRNIETIDNPPPEKLNKKRKKKGKQPLFTYKTLVIKPTGKQQQSVPRHLWENRIHLCRGHFKTYTAEAPLFGKYTGRYWWQPSVRGRSKDGVVMKDYQVEAEAHATSL